MGVSFLPEIRMAEKPDYRKLSKDAHKDAGDAADASRQHSGDLEKMRRTAKDAREMLSASQARQRKREKSKADRAWTKG
jgi:hypothetical protein